MYDSNNSLSLVPHFLFTQRGDKMEHRKKDEIGGEET
jgi:hypothetical protein